MCDTLLFLFFLNNSPNTAFNSMITFLLKDINLLLSLPEMIILQCNDYCSTQYTEVIHH